MFQLKHPFYTDRIAHVVPSITFQAYPLTLIVSIETRHTSPLVKLIIKLQLTLLLLCQ